MRIHDFEATAVLQLLSPGGSRRLCVAHPLVLGSGGVVVWHEGGATEETHVVSNHTPESLVISSVLLITRAAGGVVIQRKGDTRHTEVPDVGDGEQLVIN